GEADEFRLAHSILPFVFAPALQLWPWLPAFELGYHPNMETAAGYAASAFASRIGRPISSISISSLPAIVHRSLASTDIAVYLRIALPLASPAPLSTKPICTLGRRPIANSAPGATLSIEIALPRSENTARGFVQTPLWFVTGSQSKFAGLICTGSSKRGFG